MTGLEWFVVAASAAAIAWVNWYFFVAGRAAPAIVAASPAGAAAGAMPEITIVVDGGYAPNTVRVPAGKPVKLVFDRRDTSSCSEEVVFPDFGVRKFLPTGERTAIEVTPPKAGQYDFMCGMSMLRGRLIAD
jgi:plastocyanin domain-containing protein